MKNDLTTAEWLALDDYLVTGILPAGAEARQIFKNAMEKFNRVTDQIKKSYRG